MTACCNIRTAARTVSRSAVRAASLLASSACNACTWTSTFRTSPFRAQPESSTPRVRASELRTTQVVATTDHFELVTAILRPGRFIMTVDQGPLLAPRLGLDAARIDAMAHEILLGRLSPAVAEREVVFVRAALVAVPPYPDAQIGIRLQNCDLLIERPHLV